MLPPQVCDAHKANCRRIAPLSIMLEPRAGVPSADESTPPQDVLDRFYETLLAQEIRGEYRPAANSDGPSKWQQRGLLGRPPGR